MAKGGYQKQRLQQKRLAEKQARKKAQLKRQILGWAMAAAGVAVLAVVLLSALGGDDPAPLTQPTPDPTPTEQASEPAAPGECTKVKDIERGQRDMKAPPCMDIDAAKTYTATVRTSHGDIEIELLASVAPKTVNNFVVLSRKGFYDGLIFHRVIDDFMLQGGDPLGNGTGGPGYQFEDEFDASVNFDQPGLLAMANSGPGTNGSQFFITEVPTPHLNQMHTIFGRVTGGMDVVTEIASLETEGDRPVHDVVIRKIVIEESA